MNETASDTLKIGIACAIAVHCFGLIFFTSPKYETEDVPLNVIVKLETSTAATSPSGESIGMESLSENNLTEKKIADKKREIYLQYLEDVSLCIHARRFLMPDSARPIGIALYKIQVDANGVFTHTSLYKSSGSSKLDEAALYAVKASSGLVKRPHSTGVEPINIYQEVRYQYKLK